MHQKNIHRYKNNTFRGCRVTIMSKGRVFTAYLSDRDYRTCEETERAAIRCRDWLRAAILAGEPETTIHHHIKAKAF